MIDIEQVRLSCVLRFDHGPGMAPLVDRRSRIQSQSGFLLERAVAREASLLEDRADLLSKVDSA